ncbi:MAG: hypothetical protein V1898_00840 [Patescibacteria group bacterium]
MNHLTYVSEHAALFRARGMLKVAEDLARLLDDPLFDPAGGEKSDIFGTPLDLYESTFHDFCALCVQADLAAPALDRCLLIPRLRFKTDEQVAGRARTTQREVTSRLRGIFARQAREARMLAGVIAAFPHVLEQYPGTLDGKQLLAAVNLRLLDCHVDPIVPDYRARIALSARDECGPSSEQSVLIVDDEPIELLRTARAFVGWPNLRVAFFHCARGDRYGHSVEQERKTACEILSLNPAIILLDQGMGDVSGDGIMRVLPDLVVVAPIIVANSGGGGHELHHAGALTNCDKGRDLRGVREAVARCS